MIALVAGSTELMLEITATRNEGIQQQHEAGKKIVETNFTAFIVQCKRANICSKPIL